MIRVLCIFTLLALAIGLAIAFAATVAEPASTSGGQTNPLQEGTATPTPETWFSYFPLADNLSILKRPTLTPFPTPHPSGIKYDWTGCRHVLSNGSFENELAGWGPHWDSSDMEGVSVVRARDVEKSAQHGESVLRLHAIEGANFTTGVRSRSFPPLPRDRFQSMRIGMWVTSEGSPVFENESETLYMGLDTDCYLGVQGSELSDEWQLFWCEGTNIRRHGHLMENDWNIGPTVNVRSSSRDPIPTRTTIWLVDALSVELGGPQSLDNKRACIRCSRDGLETACSSTWSETQSRSEHAGQGLAKRAA